MNLIVCFVDDSPFEHDLVRTQIAPCAPGLEFVQTYTEPALRRVKRVLINRHRVE